jgi:hypothetical protein
MATLLACIFMFTAGMLNGGLVVYLILEGFIPPRGGKGQK